MAVTVVVTCNDESVEFVPEDRELWHEWAEEHLGPIDFVEVERHRIVCNLTSKPSPRPS
jgi:hypothetical protein